MRRCDTRSGVLFTAARIVLPSAAAVTLIALAVASLAADDETDNVDKLRAALSKCGTLKLHGNGVDIAIHADPGTSLADLPRDSRSLVTGLYFRTSLSAERIEAIFSSLPNIKSVVVQEKCWNSRIAVCAAKIQGLREFRAPECGLSQDDVAQIAKATDLEVLLIDGNPDIGASVGLLSKLRNLRQLAMSEIPLESKDITWIRNNKQLTALFLVDTQADDEIVPTLQTLPNLSLLAISGSKISTEGVAKLKTIKSLRIFTYDASDE